MAITFSCTCGQQLKASDEHTGRTIRCPQCNQTMTVPGASGTTQPDERVSLQSHPRREDGIEERREDRPRTDRGASSESDLGDGDRDLGPIRRQTSSTSGLAIFTLVLGIASFLGSCLFGIPAVLAGIWSLIAINRSGGSLTGKGFAIAGLILGIVGSLCSGSLGGIGFLSYRKVIVARDRSVSQNNLKQIGMAMHIYEMERRTLPAAATYSPDGKPLLSWRVALLPYIEQGNLYQMFDLTQPWDSPKNKPLIDMMPTTYMAPGGRGKASPGHTFYRVFYQEDANRFDQFSPIFVRNRDAQLSRITDGTSNTGMVFEAADAVPWTKPDEIPYPPRGTYASQLGGIFDGDYQVLFADGSIRYYTKGQLREDQLKAMISAHGNDIFTDW